MTPDPMPSADEWRRLCADPGRRDEFRRDLYFREGWADCVTVFGEKVAEILQSVAIINVKPDAVVARRTTRVLDYLVTSGFRAMAAVPLRLTRHSIRELWRYDWHIYPVARLAFSTMWYTSCEVLMFAVLDMRNGPMAASARLSQLKGSADPLMRGPESLRSVLNPPNRVLNYVHVADEPADVVRELAIFLDRSERLRFLREILEGVHDRMELSDSVVGVTHRVAELEARSPIHDLDVHASLRRLQECSAIHFEHATEIRSLIASGQTISWDRLCGLIDLERSRANLWDFICVASNVIPLERNELSE